MFGKAAVPFKIANLRGQLAFQQQDGKIQQRQDAVGGDFQTGSVPDAVTARRKIAPAEEILIIQLQLLQTAAGNVGKSLSLLPPAIFCTPERAACVIWSQVRLAGSTYNSTKRQVRSYTSRAI
ncbi:MAG TPA: hypothetical protein K8W19_09435 [Victivallis vadensis]|nr:hypothetical protein [Victivallis vadensis]